jgi:hypothetical protein
LIVSPALSGAAVSFTTWPLGAPTGAPVVSAVTAGGRIDAPVASPDGWIALAGDSAGDQVLGRAEPPGGVKTPLAARSASGDALEPAPVTGLGFPWTNGALAAHDGRALAALSFTPPSSMTPSIVVAVWRP